MRNNEEKEKEFVIDVRHILQTLLRFAWIIVIVGLLAGLGSFVYNSKYVTPKYSSSVMLYVNNRSFSVSGDISISAADLSASQSLIDTYIAILKARTTMEEVIEHADVDYTANQLRAMVSAAKITGTEVFTVTVTAEDPHEAAHIANAISEVLPHRIEEIVDGSSMRIVDTAIANMGKVSPNVTSNTMKATLVAVFIAAAAIALVALFDDTIRSEDYLSDNYDLPILTRVPDLTEPGTAHASRSSYSRGYGRGYGYGHSHRSHHGHHHHGHHHGHRNEK